MSLFSNSRLPTDCGVSGTARRGATGAVVGAAIGGVAGGLYSPTILENAILIISIRNEGKASQSQFA